jgi:hypothetical protein
MPAQTTTREANYAAAASGLTIAAAVVGAAARLVTVLETRERLKLR